MSTSRAADPSADEVAAVLRDAPFVRVLARADGDALAASGVLARALRSAGVPFQVRTAASPSPPAGGDTTVTVGADGGDVTSVTITARPASARAYEVADALGDDPSPALTLAGTVAAGSVPGADGTGPVLSAAETAGVVRRRPGVAVPTTDLADGLAYSTLVHAPFSGEEERASAVLSELSLSERPDEDDRRRLASLIAIEAATAPDAPPRAAGAVEAALRPYELVGDDHPFATVGGYADVLDLVARERPGTGVALALGHHRDARAAALSAWRTHARAAHRAVRGATTARYDGLFVARAAAALSHPGRLATAARLCREFRSPEPVALVVGDGAAAAASVDDRSLGAVAREAAGAVDGDGYGDERTAGARFGSGDGSEDGDGQAFEDAFREALR
jgi:hypothetical protein